MTETKRLGCIGLALAAGYLWTAAARADPASETPGTCQNIFAEVRSLRIELLQERIDRATMRGNEIRQQLQSVESDRNRLAQIDRAQVQELAEFQERLNQPGLTPEDRAAIEAQRSQMMTVGAARLAERSAEVARREAELRELLGHQQQFQLQLTEVLRGLDQQKSAH